VINDEMARQFWPDQNAVGKRFRIGATRVDRPWVTVIGVVGNVHHHHITGHAEPQFFLPHQRVPKHNMTLIVRATGDPMAAVPSVRAALRQLDPDQPIYRVRTMEEVVAAWIVDDNMLAASLGALAVIALSLASVGLYGVVSYGVAQRTHEIGIRMALGARQDDVLRLVLKQGLRLTAIGLLVGLVAAGAGTRVLSSLLYEVSATDPVIFITVPLLLGTVALLACYIPARRAMKVDPMVALRCE
jgi:putative ABC transport system permease protein